MQIELITDRVVTMLAESLKHDLRIQIRDELMKAITPIVDEAALKAANNLLARVKTMRRDHADKLVLMVSIDGVERVADAIPPL